MVEAEIQEIFHCQITPRQYTYNAVGSIQYTFSQKLNVHTVNLTQFSFYNAFSNINRFYHQFQIVVAGVDYLVTIPSNKYSFWSIFDMLTIIQTELDLQIPAYAPWTLTLVGNNNRFVQIQNAAATPFRLFFNTLQRNFNQIFQYLGFGQFDSAFKTDAVIQVGNFEYNVQTTNNIHITTRNIAINSEIQFCLATVPVNEPTGNLIQYQSSFYQMNRHILSKTNSIAIQDLTLTLLDDLGNPLDTPGNRITMVLVFERFNKK